LHPLQIHCDFVFWVQCSRVSTRAAEGFAQVLSNLKAYAQIKGYGRVYFGPQAASGFELENGTELADWAYGAQHLYASGNWLVCKPNSPNSAVSYPGVRTHLFSSVLCALDCTLGSQAGATVFNQWHGACFAPTVVWLRRPARCKSHE
jgi:hypothetical protein